MTDIRKKLEILVVEDEHIQQAAARVLLENHSLTIVGTFDEAMDSLIGGTAYTPRKSRTEKKAFDVVLTDMMFPQGRGDCMKNKNSALEENALGFPLALIACYRKIPFVAIASDASHHDNPFAYSLDYLSFVDGKNRPIKQIGESRLAIIGDACYFKGSYGVYNGELGKIDMLCRKYGVDEYEKIVPVKNWIEILNHVMGEPTI